jgi:hypothetical protein
MSDVVKQRTVGYRAGYRQAAGSVGFVKCLVSTVRTQRHQLAADLHVNV